MELDIRPEDDPPQAAIDAVDEGLHRYNLERGPMHDAGRLFAIARDADGAVRGGAVGRHLGRYAELQQFWVDESLRGRGVGSRLLAAFEEAARGKGADTVILDTFTFQAPAFYARHGYVPILELPGFPQGNALIKMRKAL
jgi:GNAT superfamily N-acetyltransferase